MLPAPQPDSRRGGFRALRTDPVGQCADWTVERERDCMLRVRAGDRAAFKELYEGTSQRVLGLLVRLLAQRDAAEDVLVDVYAQAWTLRERYDPDRGSPMAWLLTLARTRSIDRLRAGARDRVVYLGEQDWVESLPTPDDSPGLCSERSEERGRVRAALADLDPDRRKLLIRAFFGGLTYSEIADQERLPLGTVKSRIRAGLASLRAVLASLDPGMPGSWRSEEAS